MNGIHDLEGMHGFTFTELVRNEPVFKHEWEKQVVSVAIAFAAPWSIDESRFAIESIPPREYLGVPYYARWLRSFERLLVKYQFVTEQELKNPEGHLKASSKAQPLDAATILGALENGLSPRRDHGKPSRFRVGDRVIVKNEHPSWHTRAPRYVRSRQGTIHLDHGVFVFPDKGVAEHAEPLPQQIKRFLIRRRLGRGGFGVVYLAYDPGLDRLVALKVPRSELLVTGQQREDFLHEARTAARPQTLGTGHRA